MELRPYQIEAVTALQTAWYAGHRNVLLELAPGCGKSVIAAEICRRAVVKSKLRVLVLCHQKEILSQNQDALNTLTRGMVSSSIFCDGLGEKSLAGSVVFAHRDSFANCPSLESFPLVVVDEAHMISQRTDSKYQRILRAVKARFVVGLTATPYRLSGGLLYGRKKMFSVRAYTLNIDTLVDMGYLAPYEIIDENPLVTVEGDEAPDYEALGSKASVDAVLLESVRLIYKHMVDRHCTIIFCCSRAHAKAVQEHLAGCAYIDGETPADERAKLIEDLRDGKYRYVVNCNILTTGTDIPICDGVVMLRPTLSAGLFVQSIGRCLRLHPKKTKAKILELTDNYRIRFGSISDPMATYGTESENDAASISLGGDAPKKPCGECGMMVANSCKICPHCDTLFLKPKDVKAKEAIRIPVWDYGFEAARTRKGEFCYRTWFKTPMGTIREWLLTESTNQYMARLGHAKLKRLRQTGVTAITVSELDSMFPRVHTYH